MIKVQLDDGKIIEVASVKIIYEVDVDDAVYDQVHVKYTDEGRVTDFIKFDKVIGITCKYWEDINPM